MEGHFLTKAKLQTFLIPWTQVGREHNMQPWNPYK